MHTVFQTQCSWLWWDGSVENHPQAVSHQYEEQRTAPFEKGLSNLNSKILLRDGSSTVKRPLPRQKLEATSRGEPALLGGAGGHSHTEAKAEAPARLSPRAARRQVVERQPLGMGPEGGRCAAPLAAE